MTERWRSARACRIRPTEASPSKIGYGSLLSYTDHYWDVPVRLGYSIYHRGDGSNLDGQLDDVRIYDRALSPEEVAALAGQPAEGATGGRT